MRHLFLCSLMLATACSAKGRVGASCNKTAECATGTFCISAKCTVGLCQTNGDCGAGQICTSTNACAATKGGAALAITDIHGDTPTSDAGAPEGSWTTQGFAVTGTGFDATVTAQLLHAGIKLADLLVSNADASSFTAALPVSLVPGTYAVRVSTTSGGSVTRDVSILQGPPGPVGASTLTGANGVTVTGTTVSLAPPVSLTAAAASDPALTVAQGVADFSNPAASVRLPLTVRTKLGTATHPVTGSAQDSVPSTPGAVCASCAAGEVAIGGGCEQASNPAGIDFGAMKGCLANTFADAGANMQPACIGWGDDVRNDDANAGNYNVYQGDGPHGVGTLYCCQAGSGQAISAQVICLRAN